MAWTEVQNLLTAGNPGHCLSFSWCSGGNSQARGLGDVVISDYRPPTPLSGDNFWGHLLYGGAGLQARSVVVGGEVVMRDREIVTLDEAEILPSRGSAPPNCGRDGEGCRFPAFGEHPGRSEPLVYILPLVNLRWCRFLRIAHPSGAWTTSSSDSSIVSKRSWLVRMGGLQHGIHLISQATEAPAGIAARRSGRNRRASRHRLPACLLRTPGSDPALIEQGLHSLVLRLCSRPPENTGSLLLIPVNL